LAPTAAGSIPAASSFNGTRATRAFRQQALDRRPGSGALARDQLVLPRPASGGGGGGRRADISDYMQGFVLYAARRKVSIRLCARRRPQPGEGASTRRSYCPT
jgi:hypothetical protein